MPVERKGRNGGTLRSQQKGDPPLPGAGGKKKLPAIDLLLADMFGNENGEINASAAREIFHAMQKQAKKGNTRAAELLLDRMYGKVPQRNEHSGPDSGPIQFDTNAPLADKLAALAALEKIKNKTE